MAYFTGLGLVAFADDPALVAAVSWPEQAHRNKQDQAHTLETRNILYSGFIPS